MLSIHLLAEGGDGALQGAPDGRPGAAALARQQAVRLEGEGPLLRHVQELPVPPRAHRAVHRLVFDLYGNAGLRQQQQQQQQQLKD